MSTEQSSLSDVIPIVKQNRTRHLSNETQRRAMITQSWDLQRVICLAGCCAGCANPVARARRNPTTERANWPVFSSLSRRPSYPLSWIGRAVAWPYFTENAPCQMVSRFSDRRRPKSTLDAVSFLLAGTFRMVLAFLHLLPKLREFHGRFACCIPSALDHICLLAINSNRGSKRTESSSTQTADMLRFLCRHSAGLKTKAKICLSSG